MPSKKSNGFTLLIWELVPEGTQLYVIPNDIDPVLLGHIHDAHGEMVNRDENPEHANVVSLALASYDLSKTDTAHVKSWNPEWAKSLSQYRLELESSDVRHQGITHIILSGFML